ncbi:MAG: tRNA uridine-5-carboxymethylaminomethyl(34) synthesis GTPase MnmE [Endomicrobium sp.]|uniref:tRNA uridine-5-carboxymethylaminomethyl(34) synthesis GTPase MnmE n=1 Tax=Candidatus Endomicrobiellum pyrsonymphae TaxID=1408203 RepID=UPI003585A6AD|nr:tRNA uridine-5-carboxymethylaminomethyl(34) synthesis GTPase MnmE [Endomicrobium sp.]
MNYLKEDTIAALSTAAGKSAIAVIRLSGQEAFQVISKIFQTKSKPEQQVKRGYIVDGAEKKDEVLCAFFTAPHTYTGENLVEISAHGNPLIINEILNLLYKNGARPAEPGEFTYRAFLNGKKDLAEAEAVCSLITSKTATSAKAALNNVSGIFSQKIKDIRDSVTNLIAFMEANLDHPEENIMFLSRDEKLLRLDSYIESIQNLLNSYKTSKILQNGIKVAIIGKPNAGKSSLLNAILGKNRAIVTDIAGTTTDVIEETIDCHGIPLTIMDTAGLRDHADNSIEFLGQAKTKEIIGSADILIWMFDASSQLDQNDAQIADFLKKSNLNTPIIGVLNKSDLPLNSSCNIDSILQSNFSTVIKISAKTETGISKLLDEIAKIAGVSDSQSDYVMINSRHFILLQNALDTLMRTKQVLTAKDADEIACFEAVSAQTALNEILGINVKQDILDTIFSTFCIGK